MTAEEIYIKIKGGKSIQGRTDQRKSDLLLFFGCENLAWRQCFGHFDYLLSSKVKEITTWTIYSSKYMWT